MINLDNVIFSSENNSFKNDGDIYTGSISFPTSLTSGQLSVTTTAVNLGEVVQFSKFYAYFQEYLDATVGNLPQWYPANVGGQFSVGIYVNSPSPNAGWINCGIYPVIFGDQILVTAAVQNPYSNSISLNSLNVPFAFIEYTLAD